MKTGKTPPKLEMVDKKEVNEKAENKDVDLDTVPVPLSKYLLPLQGYTVPWYVQILSGEEILCCYYLPIQLM